MQLFKNFQADKIAIELYKAASKGDPAAFARLIALGNKGDTQAQFALGSMYYRGDGVPQDFDQAASWLRKSAEQGNDRAQSALGTMYVKGRGVPKDSVQAAFWTRKSAEQGYADAQIFLAFMYAKGIGMPEDLIIAYIWLNLAAAQGNEDAKTAREALGRMMTPAQIAEAQKLSREWKPKP